MARNGVAEFVQLRFRRQFAVQKKIRNFHEARLFGQLLNRITAMKEHAFVAIDIGQLAFAACSRSEARVEGEAIGLCIQLADIEHIRPDSTRNNRQIDIGVTDAESCSLFSHYHSIREPGRGKPITKSGQWCSAILFAFHRLAFATGGGRRRPHHARLIPVKKRLSALPLRSFVRRVKGV